MQDVVAHAHQPLAVETAVTAHEDDAARLEPRQLGGVVEVVDDLVASREHGVGVERARRDARHAPASAASSPGRRSAFDGMQA